MQAVLLERSHRRYAVRGSWRYVTALHLLQLLVYACGIREALSFYPDVPLHDEEGNCFWLDDAGQRLEEDPNVTFLIV